VNDTVGTLRQLFDRLRQEQERDWYPQRWGRKPSARAQEVWEHLISWWSPIGERDFEYWFPASSDELHVDFSQLGRFLYLPPLEKNAEFVPVLSMKCVLDDTTAEIKLQVMLVRRVEDCEENGEERLCGIGFRLESRHGDEEEEEDTEGDEEEERDSRHGFYHAQLIRDFGRGPSPSSECPSWLPCTQPSFPLTADCPVTLMLCLLLTLYGKRYCWEFVSKDTHLLNWLKPYLDKLQPWIKWEALA
jgi:hypothetical protein